MDHIQKIRLLCHILRYSCVIGIFVAPVLSAIYWVHDGFRLFYFKEAHLLIQFAQAPFISIDELSPWLKFAGFLADLIPCSFFMITLYLLAKLFKRYEKLDFFSGPIIRTIRQIGFVLVISQLVHPFYIALHSFILSLPNPPDQRVVIFAYGPQEIKVVFLAFIVFLAALIMEEGRHLQEENSLTI